MESRQPDTAGVHDGRRCDRRPSRGGACRTLAAVPDAGVIGAVELISASNCGRPGPRVGDSAGTGGRQTRSSAVVDQSTRAHDQVGQGQEKHCATDKSEDRADNPVDENERCRVRRSAAKARTPPLSQPDVFRGEFTVVGRQHTPDHRHQDRKPKNYPRGGHAGQCRTAAQRQMASDCTSIALGEACIAAE
jgi:hypothetical protein